MKLKGIVGKGSGKVANAVFRVRSGVQIVSQYQPKVANPCTVKQVHRRAVFKLVAQLSADLLQYIAIPWVKRISPRNRFERVNYQLLTYDDGVASINLERVQLTDSSIGIPDFLADRSSGQYIELRLMGDAAIDLDKVVYVACTKSDDGALMPFDETIVTTADGNPRFIGRLRYTPKEIVIFAYGIRINSEKARAAFGNMLVQSATEVANLVTASHNVSVGTTLTATKGLTLYYGEERKYRDWPVVDMGLPSGLLWADSNLDVTQPNGLAKSPFQYDCSFFSWGNIDGHNPTSPNSFAPWDWGGINAQAPWYDGQVYGNTPGNQLTGNIDAAHDAATQIMGDGWQMPSGSDFQELIDNCIFINADGSEVDTTKADKRVTVNGIIGLYLQSKINGSRLFFPASGYGDGFSWGYRGSYGYYWSSSLYSAASGRHLYFHWSGVFLQKLSSRYFGFPVRPVLALSI